MHGLGVGVGVGGGARVVGVRPVGYPLTFSPPRLASTRLHVQSPDTRDVDKDEKKRLEKEAEQRLREEQEEKRALEYSATLEEQWDREWADEKQRYGLDWLFEKLRRAAEGEHKYPKTVQEMGGLPLFGKSGIPEKFGGISFWKRKMLAPPPLSKYSDRGTPGSKTSGLDSFRILFNNLLQFLGNESEDGAPVAAWDPVESFTREGPFKFMYYIATGNLQELAGGPLFLLLAKYYNEYGPAFKLAFGPRSFIVISDPVMARHILTQKKGTYDKGMLAEILAPIMGKGLIPADPDTWKKRRRVIVPGFHKRWLNRMISMFSQCNTEFIASMYEITDHNAKLQSGEPVAIDMEEKFCSVTLDIIGQAVFNYEFHSVTDESPVVKAVYRTLREAEHRSTAFIPYWMLPGFSGEGAVLEGQREFARDLKLLDTKLDECIEKAMETKEELDLEDLENREYGADDDASLLRFLVDMKGEEASGSELRDDLMTMLIAGHETTAALLTWTLYEMSKSNGEGETYLERCRAEIDAVLGDKVVPDYDDLVALEYTRKCLIEGLRLYPEPPVLIRRALEDDTLPEGSAGFTVNLPRGADVFVSTWNLHRSPEYWDEPEKYDPDRWDREFQNPAVKGWKGYRPNMVNGLYPDEQASDFAFLPFGGGTRKCVGDQFAMLEATVTFALLMRRFEFEFAHSPEDVGLRTGATIHTQNGLYMVPIARKGVPRTGDVWVEPEHPVLNPGGTLLKKQQMRQEQEAKASQEAATAEPPN